MAIRVRSDGRMVCAALSKPEVGDTYIDDTLHYEMSVMHKVIGSECMEKHLRNPQWWWLGSIPEGVEIEPWRIEGNISINQTKES